MEDSVAGADRGFLVPEWRPGQTYAWIDVLLVRAAPKDVIDVRK